MYLLEKDESCFTLVLKRKYQFLDDWWSFSDNWLWRVNVLYCRYKEVLPIDGCPNDKLKNNRIRARGGYFLCYILIKRPKIATINIPSWNNSVYVTIGYPSFLSSGGHNPPKRRATAYRYGSTKCIIACPDPERYTFFADYGFAYVARP